MPKQTTDRWTRQLEALDGSRPAARGRREPITVARIVATAFDLVEAEGFEALTMRRVAATLDTGPASLYAHVANKAELDDLMIGELCSRIRLPVPDPGRWREQVVDDCRQLRDQYLRYPGVSRAALGTVPQSLETIAVSECLLAIMLAGGVPVRSAAWAIDAAFLYVSGYSLEASVTRPHGAVDTRETDRAALSARFRLLPTDRFPQTVAHADALTAGDGHERFDFTLDLLLGSL